MNDSEHKAAVGRRSIDLNADLGEGFPNDVALLDRVSSASVCCGAHAGDLDAIRLTLHAAAERGVIVGAHPGYRDREGFGRREQELSTDEVALLVLDQVADLDRIGRDLGVRIRFVKPHGALYNQAQRQEPVARGLIKAVAQWGLPLLGQPGSLLEGLARSAGLAVHRRGVSRPPLSARRLADAARPAGRGAERSRRRRGERPGASGRRPAGDALHSRRRAVRRGRRRSPAVDRRGPRDRRPLLSGLSVAWACSSSNRDSGRPCKTPVERAFARGACRSAARLIAARSRWPMRSRATRPTPPLWN